MAGARMRRVNEAVKEVLSSHLVGGLKDPRIGFVTVTDVDTSPDLRFARVYVSILGDEGERQSTLDGLSSSRGFLQAQIAHELRMKRTPALSFHFDPTVERADRMTRLIDQVAPEEDE
jgi:ribosome-binding factor A